MKLKKKSDFHLANTLQILQMKQAGIYNEVNPPANTMACVQVKRQPTKTVISYQNAGSSTSISAFQSSIC